jgi:hypothetical protein
MGDTLEQPLVKQLVDARAMEKQAIATLDKGADIVGDQETARISGRTGSRPSSTSDTSPSGLQAHGHSLPQPVAASCAVHCLLHKLAAQCRALEHRRHPIDTQSPRRGRRGRLPGVFA